MQQQQHIHPVWIKGFGHAGHGRGRAIQPDNISIRGDKGGATQYRQRPFHATACFQNDLFRGQGDVGLILEMGGDLIAQIVAVHHKPRQAACPQPRHGPIDQGRPAQLNQWLWPGFRQGAHALSKPGGQHHRGRDCGCRWRCHFRVPGWLSGAKRRSGGKCRSYQDFKSRSIGWDSPPSSQRQVRGIWRR